MSFRLGFLLGGFITFLCFSGLLFLLSNTVLILRHWKLQGGTLVFFFFFVVRALAGIKKRICQQYPKDGVNRNAL